MVSGLKVLAMINEHHITSKEVQWAHQNGPGGQDPQWNTKLLNAFAKLHEEETFKLIYEKEISLTKSFEDRCRMLVVATIDDVDKNPREKEITGIMRFTKELYHIPNHATRYDIEEPHVHVYLNQGTHVFQNFEARDCSKACLNSVRMN